MLTADTSAATIRFGFAATIRFGFAAAMTHLGRNPVFFCA